MILFLLYTCLIVCKYDKLRISALIVKIILRIVRLYFPNDLSRGPSLLYAFPNLTYHELFIMTKRKCDLTLMFTWTFWYLCYVIVLKPWFLRIEQIVQLIADIPVVIFCLWKNNSEIQPLFRTRVEICVHNHNVSFTDILRIQNILEFLT